MANIDNAYTIEILSINDQVLIASGTADPSIGVGFEAPTGSLFLRTNGGTYRKTNTANVDWVLTGVGGTDELSKVSANDTTADFLINKFVAGTNITLTETNDAGNETIVIDAAVGGVTDHALLTNIGTNTHTQIDTHIADASIHFTQAAISITESQISDLQSYLLDITGESLNDLSNVLTSMVPTDGQVLTFDTINGWQAETPATDLDVAVNVSANDTTPGFLNGKLVAGTNVTFVENNDGGNETLTISTADTDTTDHTALTNIGTNTHAQIDTHIADTSIHFTQAAISITESQISDLQSYLLDIAGESINDLSDVLTSMAPTDGQVLTFDTVNGWQAETPATDLDVAVNVSANDTTPGFLNGKLVAGSGIVFTENNDGANETLTIASSVTTGDMSSVTIGRTANVAIPLTFTNVTWNTTHVENAVSVIEHNNTNTDRIEIKETGLYLLAYSLSFDADAGEETISAQIVIDDTTIIPGSLRVASEDDEINDLSNTFTAELTAGTYITLQHMASGAGNVLHSSSSFSVTRAAGMKGDAGDQGIPGSGSTLVIQEEGSTIANSPHTVLNFIGNDVTAADAGSGVANITINSTGDLASVGVGSSSNVTIPTTFADVAWDTTHLENAPSTVEHDNTNTDRILIKETGLYFIGYSLSFDADTGEETISAQVRVNDTTIIPGSLRVASEDDEINDLSNSFTAEFTAGDFITLQHMASGTGNVLHNTSTLYVTRAKGSKGDAGAAGTPGAGSTIIIEQDNVAVTNTPHSTLNFENMEASDAGSGQVNIQNVFGSEFQTSSSIGVTTTTSTTFQNKVTLNTPSLPAGTYRVGVTYGWNHDNAGNDFESRCREDGVDIGEIHKQEPKDSAGGFSTTGTSQRHYITRTFYRTLAAGTRTYVIEFRTDSAGDESSIWDAVIEFWRVA